MAYQSKVLLYVMSESKANQQDGRWMVGLLLAVIQGAGLLLSSGSPHRIQESFASSSLSILQKKERGGLEVYMSISYVNFRCRICHIHWQALNHVVPTAKGARKCSLCAQDENRNNLLASWSDFAVHIFFYILLKLY